MGAPPASPTRYTPRHLAEKILAGRDALAGERKQVTVLFADVVGSTELIRDRDPEDAQRLLDDAVQLMMRAVHRYEGTVSRLMGDGMMAMFGAPVAHEDHAVRACYAALAMLASVRGYAKEARREHGAAIQIRVGLNCGDVVVRLISDDLHMDYTAMGQTVHLAARMEQLAEPGTATLTAETLTLVEGYVQVRSLGPVPVRGLDAPIEVYQLVGAGQARTRLQAAATRGLARFVGRQSETTALYEALERAGAGQGQVVALVGGPGVGKSRLVWELTHSHRTEGWLVLESSSVSYGKATSYLPVIDLLKAYCRVEARDDDRAIREKVLGKLVNLDQSLGVTLPALLTLLDVEVDDPSWRALDPAQRRRQTLDAVKRLLLRESQEQPLVLVFEDLHWIDSETQALLDSLVESLPTARILLLVNYRPEYSHSWGSRSSYTQLRVDPLGAASADELLADLLGADPTLEPLKVQLTDRTEGNPLFLEESVRSLVETGLLVGEQGAYRLAGPLTEIRVPATVQAVLAARIDRLPPDAKELLQTAAVIGKDVPDALLRAIAGLEEEELRRGLAGLQAAELVYEASLFPELEYTFKHALTHDVAYSSLLQGRRRELHRGIVDAIERLHPNRLAEHVERLAHHALRAESWEQSVTYCRQAGRKTAERSAYREASAYLEQALDALGRLPERRDLLEQAVDIRLELRSALLPLGDMARIAPLTHELVVIAEALGDHRRLGWGLARLTHTHFAAGEIDLAISAGERALELATVLDDLELQASARSQLGQALLVRGEYRRAVETFSWIGEAAAEVHRWGQRAAVSADRLSALVFSAACFAQLGQFKRAIASGEEAIRLASLSESRYSQAQAPIYLGYALVRRGDALRAIDHLERAVELCQTWEIAHLAPLAGAYLGAAYTFAGRFGEAQQALEQAIARAIERGRLHGAHRDCFLAESYLRAGRIDDAAEIARRAHASARARGELADEPEASWLLGEIAASGEPPLLVDAETHFREALIQAETMQLRPLQARCHLGLGKLLRRVGRLDEARVELDTAVAMLREMGMTHWLPEAEAELAQADGSAVS